MNRQPAFNHSLLKDYKIQYKPSSFPVVIDVDNPFISSISEAQLPTAECPTGTIPILWNNRQDNISTKNTNAIGTSQQQEVAGIKYWDDIYGTQAAINIYEPMVKHHWDLSGSWIQIENGPNVIGAGSWVSPSFSGDNFARFHISWGPTASKDSPQMGSGHFATEGYGKAAFARDIQVVNENNKCVSPNPVKAIPGSTNRRKYTYEDYGHNANGMHVYYGGPGSYN
uniref:Neprosin PEP catalytic domain-containing protein n=1 Tax=Oryza punctata TaxID=4537 RepID=A0A0E0L171_ORYPU